MRQIYHESHDGNCSGYSVKIYENGTGTCSEWVDAYSSYSPTDYRITFVLSPDAVLRYLERNNLLNELTEKGRINLGLEEQAG